MKNEDHEHLEHSELTGLVIRAAYEVYNELGFGFLESVYEESMLVALAELGLNAESQPPIDVYFRGRCVGHFTADLLVSGVVIIELKSVRQIIEVHETQLVNYLIATQRQVGLLINFGPKGVEVKRKLAKLP